MINNAHPTAFCGCSDVDHWVSKHLNKGGFVNKEYFGDMNREQEQLQKVDISNLSDKNYIEQHPNIYAINRFSIIMQNK